MQPSSHSIELLEEWLHEYDLFPGSNFTYSRSKDWVRIVLPIQTLENLLEAQYFVFQNAEGTTALRTLEWSLPLHVADHVDVIEPTNVFLKPVAQSRYGGPPPPDWELEHRMPTYKELVEEDILDRGHIDIPTIDELSNNPTVLEACNRLAISTLCLSVLYGMFGYKQQATDQNSIAIVNFLGEMNNRSDLNLFLERYRPEAAAAHAADQLKTELVAGGEDQQGPVSSDELAAHKGFEGALDAQTILGLGWPIQLTTYNVGSKPPFQPTAYKTENTNEPYMAWLEYMLSKDDLPYVISISYADDEKTVPPEYAQRVCTEFAKLGLRGVSVLVASGDYGTGKNEQCVRNDESGKKRFAPTFPASCPYVTSVGGTRFLDPEMVAFDGRTEFASGGGFSDIFPQPSYQRKDVNSYLEALGTQHEGLYNRLGRAIPDVSAMAYHFTVLWNGTGHMQDGTSASTPTVASIIALVNDALLADGRPPLGFLNPWIYSTGYMGFNDVTWGSNLGCNTTGFPATKGWDAATGFGSPVCFFSFSLLVWVLLTT